MLRLYLRDTKSGLTVECPMTQGQPATTITYAVWDLKSAVAALARKVAAQKSKNPVEVLFGSPPFEIVAKWEVE